MKINKKILIIILGFTILIGIILFFLNDRQKKTTLNIEPKNVESKEEIKKIEEDKEKQVCLEGLSWNFRGVEYKMTGWENHELAGKTRKLCCGISKEYEDTVYKVCVYGEDYILWIKAPYTDNEFRKDTVGYQKDERFCKISYDYYQPGEKIESEDCY